MPSQYAISEFRHVLAGDPYGRRSGKSCARICASKSSRILKCRLEKSETANVRPATIGNLGCWSRESQHPFGRERNHPAKPVRQPPWPDQNRRCRIKELVQHRTPRRQEYTASIPGGGVDIRTLGSRRAFVIGISSYKAGFGAIRTMSGLLQMRPDLFRIGKNSFAGCPSVFGC